MAEKKDKLLKEALERGFRVGDKVCVKLGLINKYTNNVEKKVVVDIIRIVNDDTVIVKDECGNEHKLATDDIRIDINKIGANPFVEKSWREDIKLSLMPIGSIMSYINVNMYSPSETIVPTIINGVEVKEINFNPYVIINDKKIYYQRPFCWSLEDKQKLIESIYEDNNCGNIVLRERSWKTLEDLTSNGENELAFWDVVDGKQRLDALISFINDGFKDFHDNFYSDLSEYAQRKFRNSSAFGFVKLDENVTDEDTIKIFLHVNCSGKQMPEEHLNKIKNLTSIL